MANVSCELSAAWVSRRLAALGPYGICRLRVVCCLSLVCRSGLGALACMLVVGMASSCKLGTAIPSNSLPRSLVRVSPANLHRFVRILEPIRLRNAWKNVRNREWLDGLLAMSPSILPRGAGARYRLALTRQYSAEVH